MAMLTCPPTTESASPRRGVELVDGRVERIGEQGGRLRIVVTGRAPLARHALFIQPKLALASDLAVSLGAALTEIGSVETDAAGQTSVRGLYAAGDAGSTLQSVAVATGSGARAAYAINAELAMEGTSPSAVQTSA
jgi:thioredoxin reductase